MNPTTLVHRSLGIVAVLPGCVAAVLTLGLWLRGEDGSWAVATPALVVLCVGAGLLFSRRWGHVGIGLLLGLALGAVLCAALLYDLANSLS